MPQIENVIDLIPSKNLLLFLLIFLYGLRNYDNLHYRRIESEVQHLATIGVSSVKKENFQRFPHGNAIIDRIKYRFVADLYLWDMMLVGERREY